MHKTRRYALTGLVLGLGWCLSQSCGKKKDRERVESPVIENVPSGWDLRQDWPDNALKIVDLLP